MQRSVCEQVANMNAAIKEKRLILTNRKTVFFHHDNKRRNVTKVNIPKFKDFKWGTHEQPNVYFRLGSFGFFPTSIEQFK